MNVGEHPESNIEKLRTALERLPNGPFGNEIESLLVAAWNVLDGGDAGGMQAYKINGRAEDRMWSKPILSFRIERHGATANGSVYAELQHWEIDSDKGTANLVGSSRRQVHRKSNAVKIEPIAKELALAILNRTPHPGLQWVSETEVRLLTSRILPEGAPAQTRAARRKRLYAAIQHELSGSGWERHGNTPNLKRLARP